MGDPVSTDIRRVQFFEGLTLADFDNHLIEPLPGSTEALQWVKARLDDDPYGDPERIDPGEEAARVATLFMEKLEEGDVNFEPFFRGQKIFFADITAYREQTHFLTWERRRGQIAKALGLSRVTHPFVRLFDRIPINDVDMLRGLPAFDALADQVIAALPDMKQTRILRALYPGAGTHIAPLLTILQLIDRGILDTAELTFTEIKDLAPYLWALLQRGTLPQPNAQPLFAHVRLYSAQAFSDGGSEQVIEVVYKGRPIRITFALNRSGDRYYRPEYLDRADLVILHDPGVGSLDASYHLLADLLMTKAVRCLAKPQMVIMEGGYRSDIEPHLVDGSAAFPFKPTELPGPYGHCDGADGIGEIGPCDYATAYVFPLHHPKLLALTKGTPTEADLAAKLYRPSEAYQIRQLKIPFVTLPPGKSK